MPFAGALARFAAGGAALPPAGLRNTPRAGGMAEECAEFSPGGFLEAQDLASAK